MANNYMSISKLSELCKADRKAIKKYCFDNGIDDKKITKSIGQTVIDYYSELNAKREKENAKYKNVRYQNIKVNTLSEDEIATKKERLLNSKKQYNFNENMIVYLQQEIEQMKIANGNLSIEAVNGSMTIIPQAKYLDTYIKLNISLNNQINTLETELGLMDTCENKDDPFR